MDETAYVGQINRARITGTEVSLEVSLDADVPTLQNSMIYANRMELDMPRDFEFSRNHWAIKDVEGRAALTQTLQARMQTLLGH